VLPHETAELDISSTTYRPGRLTRAGDLTVCGPSPCPLVISVDPHDFQFMQSHFLYFFA